MLHTDGMMLPLRQRNGFTIVELLIVIVVIGILAAIALIAFSGISGRADVAAIQADLGNAGRQMKIFHVDNGSYPTANDCAATPVAGSVCLKPSGATSFQFTVNNSVDPRTFCITATRGSISYYVTQETGAPLRGACPGHIADGGPTPNTFTSVTITPQTSTGTKAWTGVAMSADGTKIGAVATSNRIYTSSDSGATWTVQAGSPSASWTAIAMSADGTKLAATVTSGDIWTSADSGVTWTDQTTAGTKPWTSIDMSSDGTKIVAGAAATSSNVVISSDLGATWTTRTAIAASVTGVAIANDGSTILAAPTSGNNIRKTVDSGTSWTNLGGMGGEYWRYIACNSTCSTFMASTSTTYMTYYSINGGASRVATTITTTSSAWTYGASVSDDGSKMVTGTTGDYLMTSTINGTWVARTSIGVQAWRGFASSSDGGKFVGVASSGYIYVGTWQ